MLKSLSEILINLFRVYLPDYLYDWTFVNCYSFYYYRLFLYMVQSLENAATFTMES